MVIIPSQIAAPDHLSMGLLVHRPDLASALYRAHAASRLVRVATTQFYPTIDLTGFVGFNALTLAKGTDKLANFLFSGQSLTYGLAPGLRMPWFEGGDSVENWVRNVPNTMLRWSCTMRRCWMRCGKWPIV